jgi:xylan 1,4-beta-xylosidase
MQLLKTLFAVAVLLSLFYLLSRSNPASAKDSMKTFQEPILPGFHPDPSIVRVGSDFYLTNSTFEYFPGLPIYHSRDLVHWELIGNALNRPSQLPLKEATDTGGLYAPTIRYWKGLFYLTCNNVSGGGNFIVTAKDPKGPWSEPLWMGDFGIDGSMLFDDDGKAYYTRHEGGERGGIAQAEFDPETGKLTTPMKVIYNDLTEPWNEGPHLYKIKGHYYLMMAQGGTGDRHMEIITRSDSPWGPFTPCPQNPILTERDEPHSPIQCTGHADLFEAPDGSWWMVFLGTRPQDGASVLGRETFLAPVNWTEDGWPMVNGDHHVTLEMSMPKLKPFPVPKPRPRTVFSGKTLGPEWIHIRNADPGDFSLERKKGYLSLRTAAGSLSKKEETPAFAGQRQPSFRVTVRTAMEFEPSQDGEEAGLCVRANESNHYEVGVERLDGKRMLFARNTVKDQTYTLVSQPVEPGLVQLEISGSESQYQFAWSPDGKAWTTLGASTSVDLSREKAGGFTGAVIGIYASANGKDSQDWADFSWFEVLPGVAPEPTAISARPTPTPQPASDTWRIRAGGGDFTDHEGRHWSQDQAFSGGDTVGAGRPMAATADQALYQTERWGSDFSYNLPVPPGKYQVSLKFAETYVKNPGERVFDVFINDKKVLERFDILKEAGAVDKALDKIFKDIQPGADGQIQVRFVGEIQNAKVCAIEVVRQK